MSISFNQIPIDIRVPGQYIEFDNSRAQQGLPAMPHKILVIGQRLAAGTVLAGVPTRILSADQAQANFGRGSMLHVMARALRNANNYTECWAVALDDNVAGVAAIGSINATAPPTAAGTLNFYIGGNRVQVAITATQTAAQVATAIAAAVNALTDLPVTAAVDGVITSKVNLTCRWKGETGNSIDLRLNYYQGETLPAGLAFTLTAMTGGTSNPDVSAAITAIGAEQYNTIIMPYVDTANLTALETELSNRWGPLVMKEGQAFAAAAGTFSAIDTIGAAQNSPFVTIMGAQGSPTTPWEIAAVTGAVDAYEPDPARPRQTLTLTGVLAPWTQDRYTLDERNIHLHDGISTFVVDAGGNVLIERLITTYQTNALGVQDISYLDIETMRTIAYLRYSIRSRIALKFPRHKLADDGTRFGPGQAIVTPKIIRAELIALFMEWEDAGLAEDITQFKTDLLVQRDGTDPNRVDAVIPPNIINQFRVFAGQVQFRL